MKGRFHGQRRRAPLALALLAVAAPAARAQIDTAGWRISAREARVETYQGRQALALRDGVAWLPGSTFENGTIELDIAVADSFGFTGVQFRAQDAGNYEDYYLRPFMSGNPDATQYQPVFDGNTGWQIYVGDRYTAPLRFRFETWMRVKLVVDGTAAEVYLDGAPAQYIPALVRPPRRGMVGIYARAAPVRFANVRVTSTIDAPLVRREVPAIAAPPGTVTAWSVSSVVEERRLAGRDRLSASDEAGLTWTRAAPTERGIVNLGALHARDSVRNTVVAALTLTADAARTLTLKFGFSDRVRVYLDGRLLYAGDDGYRTRDYRFLGTVGLFDEVALPLRAGANSLWLAVSESFGGWAVTAALEDPRGVRVSPGCGRVVCGR